MFGQERKRNEGNVSDYQLIIIGSNKDSIKIGTGLHEAIAKCYKEEKIVSVVWDEKHFNDNRPKITSKNKLVAIGQNLGEKLVLNPFIKDAYNDYGVHIRINGCHCVVYVESIPDDKCKELEKILKTESGEFSKTSMIPVVASYVGVAFLGGTIGVILFSIYRYFKKEKAKTLIQYWYAIDVFQKFYLKKFLMDNE